MSIRSNRNTKAAIVLAGLLAAGAVGVAFAHGDDDGPGYGPWGHMGPGMMGGGYGPGMMGGGYGPGMMGGGYGPGARGGWGYGPGARRNWDGDFDDMPNLSPDQRQKIGDIIQQHRQEQERLMGEVAKRRAELAATMSQQSPNPDTVSKAYKAMADAQAQLLQNRVKMHNQMEQALGGSRGGMMEHMPSDQGTDE